MFNQIQTFVKNNDRDLAIGAALIATSVASMSVVAFKFSREMFRQVEK